jgi:hypothetical protein
VPKPCQHRRLRFFRRERAAAIAEELPKMEKTITAEEIREIAGTLEDSVVTAIIATGATVKDVSEAYLWLTDDDPLARELQHACKGRAAIVCDLLASELEPPPEPARRPNA